MAPRRFDERLVDVTAPVVREIAERAQQFKVLHLAMAFGLPCYFLPGLPILRTMLEFNGATESDDMPLELPSDLPGEDERLVYSAREVMTKASMLRGDIVGKDLMSVAMILGAIRIGDMILSGGYLKSDVPLLQFARHYRNACAHGDRWEFRGRRAEGQGDMPTPDPYTGTKWPAGHVHNGLAASACGVPRRHRELLSTRLRAATSAGVVAGATASNVGR